MKIEAHTIVEDDTVMGKVSTNIIGSECTFPICSVEEWEELSEEEAEKLAMECLWESGMIDWSY